MEPNELKPILEALLFAAETPLSMEQLVEATDSEAPAVSASLQELAAELGAAGRGLRLAEEAGGWIVLTREEYAPFVGRLLRGKKKMRLSRPALETLAIIAYKQPVTKAEVDAIRGVDSSGVLNTLLERALVTIRGRSKALGRPLLYGTTGEFLSYFGLKDLSEMPRVEELKAIVGEREPENPEAEPDMFLASEPGPGGESGGESEADAEARREPLSTPRGAPDDPLEFALADDDGEDPLGVANDELLTVTGGPIADGDPTLDSSDEARAASDDASLESDTATLAIEGAESEELPSQGAIEDEEYREHDGGIDPTTRPA